MQKNLFSTQITENFVPSAGAPKSPFAAGQDTFIQTQPTHQSLHIKTDQEGLNNNDYVQPMECLTPSYTNCGNGYQNQQIPFQHYSYQIQNNNQPMSPSYSNLSPHVIHSGNHQMSQVMGPPNPVSQSPHLSQTMIQQMSPAASQIQHSYTQQLSPHPGRQMTNMISPGYQNPDAHMELSPHPVSANIPVLKQMFVYPPYSSNSHINGNVIVEPRKLHHQRVATLSGDKPTVPRSAGFMLSQQNVPLTPGYVNYSKPVAQTRTYPGSLPSSPFISGEFLQQNQNAEMFQFPTVPDENNFAERERNLEDVEEEITQISPNEPLQDLGDIEEDLVPDSPEQSMGDIFAPHEPNGIEIDTEGFTDVPDHLSGGGVTSTMPDSLSPPHFDTFASIPEPKSSFDSDLLAITTTEPFTADEKPSATSSVTSTTDFKPIKIEVEQRLSSVPERKKRGRRSGSPKSAAQCFTCGKLFNNSSALAKHKLTHSEERKYICHICSKGFKRQDHLNGHLLTHQSKKPFACRFDQCDKSYCDARSLRRHLENIHHLSPGTINKGGWDTRAPNFTFDVQSSSGFQGRLSPSYMQQFSPITPDHPLTPGTRNRLVQRINMKNSRPPVECSVCGRKFKNMPALNGHMRLHGGFVKPKAELIDHTNSVSQSNPNGLDLLARTALSQSHPWQFSTTSGGELNPLLAKLIQTGNALPPPVDNQRKRKHRPQPLVIPPHLSNFHTLGFGFPSQLRSPWQRNKDEGFGVMAPPYTPPPMLSPMRTGSGLFYSILSRSLGYKSAAPSLTPIKEEEQQMTRAFPKLRTPILSEGLPPATDVKPHINLGQEYQAAIPDFVGDEDNSSDHTAELLWTPSVVDSVELNKFDWLLEFACSLAIPFGGENQEYLLNLLNSYHGDIKSTLLALLNNNVGRMTSSVAKQYQSEIWTRDEQEQFQQCLAKHEKDFYRIADEMKTKNTKQCVDYYYLWKKICPEEHKRLRTQRRRKEQEERNEQLGSQQPQGTSVQQLPFAEELKLNVGHVTSTTPDPPLPANTTVYDFTQNCTNYSYGTSSVEHDQAYPCRHCDKVFSRVKARNAHLKSHKIST